MLLFRYNINIQKLTVELFLIEVYSIMKYLFLHNEKKNKLSKSQLGRLNTGFVREISFHLA